MAEASVPAANVPDLGLPVIWTSQAVSALVEAQVMSGSIRTIAESLIENCDSSAFSLLEAIVACTQRLEAAVDPVLDESLFKQSSPGNATGRG